jgi:hypothetical protein
MWYRIPAALTLMGATLATGAIAFTRSPMNHRYKVARENSIGQDDSPVGSLDRCLQVRFRNLDGMGLSRLPITHANVQRFEPETANEIAAVSELKKDGFDSAFYLGGRDLLEQRMTDADLEKPKRFGFDGGISEPVVVTDKTALLDLPKQRELREHGRKALLASIASDPYRSSIGRWSIEARPVRADRQECLNCHAPENATRFPSPRENSSGSLRVGDALGVLIYVYAQTPK